MFVIKLDLMFTETLGFATEHFFQFLNPSDKNELSDLISR